MHLLSILCTMGLPSIDQSLVGMLGKMESIPPFIVSLEMLAKVVGGCIALGIGSYESWMMMLGRRGIDVMKLLRIVIISFCITFSSTICSSLQSMTTSLESQSKTSALGKLEEVAFQEKVVAQLQKDYLEKLRAVQDSIAQVEKIEKLGEDASWYEEMLYSITSLGDTISNFTKRAALAAETKISEWINDIIRFVGMLIFQMVLYGLLVAQRLCMAILAGFAPLMFALSLAPPWKSAWSQWMSKYITVGLWGFVAWVVVYYVCWILLYTLELDTTAYSELIGHGQIDNSWEQIGTLGLQGVGSNCMYVMGMLVGAYVLQMAPEIASWLIPGGVSSGAGHQAGSAVMAGASMVAGGASAVAGAIGGQAGKNLQGKQWDKGPETVKIERDTPYKLRE